MSANSKKINVLLWILQVVVAALFLFAGGYKLIASPSALAGPIALPIPFLRFMGAAEVLGALGLILPGLVGIHRWLTPLAALGLVIIMTGATVLSAIAPGPGAALVPLAVGLLCLVINRGRGGLGNRVPVRTGGRVPAFSA
jgi:F0F1-type ATP synthase assembly protein I